MASPYSMREEHKTLLRRKSVKLASMLGPSIDDVVEYLLGEEIITSTMKDNILLIHLPPKARAHKLLDLLPTRGVTAFSSLLSAVLDSELWDAADILEPEKAPHDPKLQANNTQFTVEESSKNVKRTYVGVEQLSAGIPQQLAATVSQSGASGVPMDITDGRKDDGDDDKEEPLPAEWPSQDHMNTVGDLRLKAKKVQANQKKMYEFFLDPETNNVYRMKRKKRGRVLIIINFEFTKGLPNRLGYQQDRKALERVFQDLMFETSCEDNLSKDKMLEVMTEECNRDHIDHDCFVLIIISHGKKGKVFGTDGKINNVNGKMENYIEIDAIAEMFYAVNSLQKKPKLIFIEACQTKVVPSGMQTSGASPDISSQGAARPLDKPGNSEINDSWNDRYDLFLVIATSEGYQSMSYEHFGSVFTQALCYVLANYAYKHELSELMRKICQLLKKDHLNRQRPLRTADNMDKAFYFFPGLPRDS